MAIEIKKYEQKLKVKYFKNPQSLFELSGTLKRERWMNRYFPLISAAKHKELRDEAGKIADQLQTEWHKLSNLEYESLFHRPITMFDYKIGVARDDYSEATKKHLQEIWNLRERYLVIQMAHNEMLPGKLRKNL